MSTNKKQGIVVCGNGLVGQDFFDKWASVKNVQLAIHVVAAEPRLAYDRFHLSE